MIYAFLADVVVAVHFLYVGFVLFGELAICAGAVCRWEWILNPWFRWVHLCMIAIVVLESLAGIVCPLTVWEDSLRRLAGQEQAPSTFIGRWLHDLFFFDAAPWVFTTAYVSFGAIVVLTFWWAPPRGFSWKRR